ncbi:hypothetical protein CH63R_03752 [Colletotrichum higginsianum IMI 349063]|uniref:Uncharacterized protein n=1 Tax=Colletotrichum higginsianum (strain IMI 349063) TaxID=759273 RepID=A0A1B7YHC3_COLHI|nr:hypothetical protein CH63R_03752 [Colletotrichum higginsianum IMI 349063]OBR11456.1 hypothetical protein CH63R_03752 [Colletotrichum higginsianum IMI 349063]
MASRNLLAIAAVSVVLFLNLVLANPLPLFDHTSGARTLRSREDDLPYSGYMQLTIPPADTTKTQVSTTAGGGGLEAFAVLNEGGSILLVVYVERDYVSDDFNGLSGYRITVQCHESTIHFEQYHDLLYHDRRSLWARVSARQLDEWREEYETNEDSDIDITIWWEKDSVNDDDESSQSGDGSSAG